MGPQVDARRTLPGALLVAASGSMPMMLAGALVVQIKSDLRVDDPTFGWSIGSFFLASAAMSTWSGRLVDRIGWQSASLLAGCTSLASLVGVALFGHSFSLLVACIALGGVGHALAMPATNLALMREVSAGRRGLAFGIKQTSVPAAGLLAGLTVPTVAVTVGWRWAFVLTSIVPISALIVMRGGRDVPSIERPKTTSSAAGTLDRRPLIALAIGGALAAAAVTAVTGFVVASAVESGVEIGTAGVFVAVASAGGLFVRVFGGWAADVRSTRGLRPAASLLVVGAAGLLLLATERAALVLPGMVVTFAAGWGWPGLFHYGVSAHHPDAPGSATGIVQVGVMLGGTLGPVVAGHIASNAGYGTVWLVCALLVVVSAGSLWVGAWMLDRRGTHRNDKLDPAR